MKAVEGAAKMNNEAKIVRDVDVCPHSSFVIPSSFVIRASSFK
jgi:hypothetical protein